MRVFESVLEMWKKKRSVHRFPRGLLRWQEAAEERIFQHPTCFQMRSKIAKFGRLGH